MGPGHDDRSRDEPGGEGMIPEVIFGTLGAIYLLAMVIGLSLYDP